MSTVAIGTASSSSSSAISRLGAAVATSIEIWLASLSGAAPAASADRVRVIVGAARAILALGAPAWILYKVFVQPFLLSPLRKIPGPSSNPLTLLGNIPELAREEAGAPFLRWATRYGGVVVFRALFNTPVLLVTDPTALRRIYGTHAHLYNRPEFITNLVKELVGESVLSAVGATHKRQRALLNPSFRVKELAGMTPTFARTGFEHAASWRRKIDAAEAAVATTATSGEQKQIGVVLAIFEEVSKCTLDIIGRTAFGYEFHSLQGQESALNVAFQEIMKYNAFSGVGALRAVFPFVKLLPSSERRSYVAAKKLLKEKCDEIFEARVKSVEQGDCKDLLSILIRANQDAEEKMSRNELRDQILTFVLAGHETTSTTLTWALLHLADHPAVQARLHAEVAAAIHSPSPDTLSYDLVNSLRYTDAVVKETLRFIPTVPFNYRYADEDDILQGYAVPKGTIILTPPIVMHRLKSLWGEDADSFNPDRWPAAAANGDDTAVSSERAFGAYMPFSLGPRNCIGSRFATVELKVLLAILIREFEFAPVPDMPRSRELQNTMKPIVHLRVTPRSPTVIAA
ncbi:cytochrome P450 [Zopfochytrium polystomum]|nr:cytochrome P450 [Zopfochytrium polystomum]